MKAGAVGSCASCKLQSLLKKEFAERKIDKDPDNLEESDRGLESRAARAPRQSRAQKAEPSDGDEAAASKRVKSKCNRGRSAQGRITIGAPVGGG